MAASYPGAIKSFSQVTNGVTKLVALLFNSAYDEIEAVETELGTDVAGSLTDLKTRLAVAFNADGTLKATTVVHSTTYDVATASGNQDITSFGFDPKSVMIIGIINGSMQTCIGMSDGTNNKIIYYHTGNTQWQVSTSHAIGVASNDAPATSALGTITMITDGIRIAWVKTGSPTGTLTILILGIGI